MIREALEFHLLADADRKILEAGLARLRPAFEAGDVGRAMAWGFALGSKSDVPESAESYLNSERAKGKGRAPDLINDEIIRVLEDESELSAKQIARKLGHKNVGGAWHTRVSRVKAKSV